MASGKQDAEQLINETLPFAKQMLRRHGEFHPFGAYMQSDGTIVQAGAEDPETEYPDAANLIDTLRSEFSRRAVSDLRAPEYRDRHAPSFVTKEVAKRFNDVLSRYGPRGRFGDEALPE